MEKIGKYEVLGQIGRGGMGVVYKAHDPHIQRTVAIKVLSERAREVNPDGTERFIREARLAGRLSHENITIVHEVGMLDQIPYIVMEFLEGEDLRQSISQCADLDLNQKINVALQICRGLDFAHSQGVTHRDIKPENIRVLPSGKIKIMDFGIAKPESSQFTTEGVMLGTPSYFSPEQVQGWEVDHRSDIFSFGILFHELLTYKKLFSGNLTRVVYQIAHENPEIQKIDGGDFVGELESLLTKCLEKDPKDRFQSFREVCIILEQIFNDSKDTAIFTHDFTPEYIGQESSTGGTTMHNLLKSGKAHYQDGDLDKAERFFNLILERSPDHKIALSYLQRIKTDRLEVGATSVKPSVTDLLRETKDTVRLADPGDSFSGQGRAGKWVLLAAGVLVLVAAFLWFGLGRKSPDLIEPTPEPIAGRTPPPTEVPVNPQADRARLKDRDLERMDSQTGPDQVDALAAPLVASARNYRELGQKALAEDRFDDALNAFAQAQDAYDKAFSETRARKASGDLAKMKTLTEEMRLNADRAHAQALEKGGRQVAGNEFRAGVDHRQKAEGFLKNGRLEDLIQAQREFTSAKERFEKARSLAEEVSRLRSEADQAKMRFESVKNEVESYGDALDQNSNWIDALALEKQSQEAWRSGNFERAKAGYGEAKIAIIGAKAQVESAFEKQILSLKNRATAAKQVADSQGPFYTQGLDFEQLAAEAFEEKSYLQAVDFYSKAVRAFGMSQPEESGSDVVVPVKDERAELDQAIAGLINLYGSLMKAEDLDGLANFLHYSKSERQGWKLFFDTAEDIQADVAVEETKLLGDRGEVRLKVSLAYFNKRNRSQQSRDFDLHWNLKKVPQGWQVVP